MKKRFFAILSLLFTASLLISCIADKDRDNPFDPFNKSAAGGAPFIPENLAVVTVSTNSIAISWDGSAGVTGYRVYRSTNGVTFAQVTTVTGGSSTIGISYTDSGLNPGTLYYYTVSAYNNAGESDKCVAVSIETVPNTASLAVSAATIDSITLTWNSISGADGYRVYQSADNIDFTQIGGDITSGTTYTDTGLTAGTTYYYQITSYSSGGESVKSSSISGITVTVAPVISDVGSATVNSLSVSWGSVTGAAGYRVYRSADNITYTQISGNVTSGLFYTDTGLNAATTYYYKITAYNNGGESAQSSSSYNMTTPNETSLTLGTATVDSISISWNSVTGADGYRVYNSTDNVDFTQVGSDITSGTSFTDTGLGAGTTRYYRVSSYNSGGESAMSNSITGITVPAAPTNVTVSYLAPGELSVEWDGMTGASGYRVYSSKDNTTFTLVSGDITSGTAYTATGLSFSTTYYYRVTAYNSAGASADSDTKSCVTNPDMPSGLAVEYVTADSISISWNSVTGADGYRVYCSTDNITFTQTGSDITSGTSYTVTGIVIYGATANLVEGNTYYIKVSSYNSGGESAQSSSVTGVPLAAPTGFSAAVTANNGQITVSWTAVTGANSYNIYYSNTTGVTKANGTKITGATSPYVHADLIDGTRYYYIVTAVNGNSESIASAEAAVTAWALTWTERTGAGLNTLISVASSSDGTKLAAAMNNGYLYTSIDSGANWTQRTGPGIQDWTKIVSSSDGTVLAAGSSGSHTYISTDSGATWVEQTSSPTSLSIALSSDGTKLASVNTGYINTAVYSESAWTWREQTGSGSRQWNCITMSADGTKLAAGVANGYIYTSSDSGVTWTAKTNSGSAAWTAVSMSSDGVYIAASGTDYIAISTDSGENWSQILSGVGPCYSLAISTDGRIIAAAFGGATLGYIYTSVDRGETWGSQNSAGYRNWWSIAMSSDGSKLVAGVFDDVDRTGGGGYIYTAE